MILYINGNYPYHSLHSELVYKLAEMGNDITVFAPMRGQEGNGLYPCDHPRVRIIYSDCLNYTDRVLFIPKVKKIAKIIEQQVDMSEVDCILAGTVYSDGSVAYLLHRKYQIPFSVAVRETDVTYQMKFRPYLNGYIKHLLSEATKVIFLSPAYEQYFEKFKVDQNKFIVIPNAVNDYWFQQRKNDRVLHDPCSLIFVGEISKRKNVATTIRVVAELINRNIKSDFHIIGSGSEEAQCRTLAKELNVEDRVFFHGWQDGKEKIKAFYDQSDIFVMLSHRETFGTVYIEALSQGLPVIFTRGQGIDGYFEEGSVGYSCNPTDVKSAADSIIRIMNQYSIISRQCIQQSDRFKWERVAEQYHEVICNMRG